MKRFKMFTLGCKVNQYETQAMREILVALGLKEASGKCPADIYVINSCTVTARADRKSLELIRRSKKENPEAKIVLAGCLVDGSPKPLSRIVSVDYAVANRMKNRLAEIIGRRNLKKGPFKITDFKGHSRAFVKIQDGCDNFCAYCRIPLVRGKSRSRSLAEIKNEVAGLVKKGFQEIVLTGICLGDYGKDFTFRIDLADAVEELEKIKGTFRIRLSSIEAKDINTRLIDKLVKSRKMCNHLHIPFQSGDDKVLKDMQRDYQIKDYLRVVRELRKALPDIAITTDIMVGFPGEGEHNFRNTFNFIKKVSPPRVHIFPFSLRPGTKADTLPGRVDGRTIKIRERVLAGLAKKIQVEYYERFKGRTLTVLVEHKRDGKSGLLTGYTQNYIPVLFSGEDRKMGRLVRVKIGRIESGLVSGRIIK